MASAVKKAIIYTLIAAVALPLYFALRGWFSVPPFALFLWFAPLVIGSWLFVFFELLGIKQGKKPDRNIVYAVCTAITAVVGLWRFSDYLGFGLLICIPFYIFEFLSFVVLFFYKKEQAIVQAETQNQQHSAVKIIDITNGKV